MDERGTAASRQTSTAASRRVGGAVLVALALTVVVSVVAGQGSTTVGGRLGGDYPAFYAAGRIVVSADRDRLYEADAQRDAQAALFGDETDGYLAFAYPPYVALVEAPFAALPYRLAYLAHTVVMAAAVAAALWLLRPRVALVDRHYVACLAAALAFFPLYRGVTAGQNTALVLLLLVASWRAAGAGRDGWAGVLLALTLYKPQFAVPMLGLWFVRGRFRLCASAAFTAVALWAIGAAVLGIGWLVPWWEHATSFSEVDAVVNGANAVSWLGVADARLGVGDALGRVLGALLVAATAVIAVVVWRRPPLAARDPGVWAMAVAAPTVVLVSPHAMFYDAGLLVLPLLVLASTGASRRGLVAVFALAYTHGLADALGTTPLAALTVAVFAWAVVAARRAGPPPVHDDRPIALPLARLAALSGSRR